MDDTRTKDAVIMEHAVAGIADYNEVSLTIYESREYLYISQGDDVIQLEKGQSLDIATEILGMRKYLKQIKAERTENMEKYFKRPAEVEAVKLEQKHFEDPPEEFSKLIWDAEKLNVYVGDRIFSVGDYLVKVNDFRFEGYTADEFRKQYMRIAD